MREQRMKLEVDIAKVRFVKNHPFDYYQCDANRAIIEQYIADNNLDPRVVDNYEIAFSATQDRLAGKPSPALPQQVEEIPPPAPRRQADGGLQPGSEGRNQKIACHGGRTR
jgi:hypothetical protein